MKKLNLSAIALIGALAIFINSNLLAQDTTRVRAEKQVQAGQGTGRGETNQQEIQHGNRFEDKNGDGVNDNAPDHDGDGVPNGQDSDYDGAKNRTGNGKGGFIDENGDGINDHAEDWDNDGIPNGKDPDFTRPQNGTGQKNQYGKQNKNQSGKKGVGPKQGTGPCTKQSQSAGDGKNGSNQGNGKK